jgi:hypothetical protein
MLGHFPVFFRDEHMVVRMIKVKTTHILSASEIIYKLLRFETF